jgi:hypothetical protein
MATNLIGQYDPHLTQSRPSLGAAQGFQDTTNIFRFFDLPRELRDKIYEQPVLSERWRMPAGDIFYDRGFCTKVEKLRSSLLLVNRHFKDEYTERCLDREVLCLRSQVSNFCSVFRALDRVESWITAMYTTVPCEQYRTTRKLENYLESCALWYQKLPTANVRMYLEHENGWEGRTPHDFDHLTHSMSDLESFGRIAKLEVYMISQIGQGKAASESRRLLARWRRKDFQSLLFPDPAFKADKSEWEDFDEVNFSLDNSASLHGSSASRFEDENNSSSGYEDSDDGDDYDHDNDSGNATPDHAGSQGGEGPQNSGGGDERDDESACDKEMDGVAERGDPNSEPASSYFDLFGLPRGIRDMIYHQFQRLHPDTPMFQQGGQPESMITKIVATKPLTSLLLANKAVRLEYLDACEKRSGLLVSDYMEGLIIRGEDQHESCPVNVEKAFFIHMHVGGWMDFLMHDDLEWTLRPLKVRLLHLTSNMPKLDSITVSVYLWSDSIMNTDEIPKLERALEDFVSVPKLRELKVITMDNADGWDLERKRSSKKLLVQWTSSDARKPTVINSPIAYTDTCCGLFGESSSDSEDSSSEIGLSSDSEDTEDES